MKLNMFRIICENEEFEFTDVASVVDVVAKLRDTSIIVVDHRSGGKHHHLVIEASGGVHEMYGSRLVVRDVGLLIKTPGRPVYA